MRLPNMRFKIHCLMALVLYTAIGLAALRSSSYLWLRAVNTLVLAILFISILAATHYRGPKRAFWLGYALFRLGLLFPHLRALGGLA